MLRTCIAIAAVVSLTVSLARAGEPPAADKKLSGVDEKFVKAAARGGEMEVGLGKLAALQGVRRFPSRIKCAMLGWRALDECLNGAFDPSLAAREASHANVQA